LSGSPITLPAPSRRHAEIVGQAAVRRWPVASFRLAAVIDGLRDCAVRWSPRGRARLAPEPGWPYRPRVTAGRGWVLHQRLRDPAVIDPFPGFVASPDPLSIRSPAVLVTFHFGALEGLGGFLTRLPGDVLVLRFRSSTRAQPGITRVDMSGFNERQRAQVLARSVSALRAGGFVFTTVDGRSTSYVDMPVFDRVVAISGGAFAVARLARAPMLPVTARWRRDKLEIIVGDPIPAGDAATMGRALGRWVESYISRNPRELRWPLVSLRPTSRSRRTGLEERTQATVPNLAVLSTGYRPPGQDDYAAGREPQGTDDLAGDAGGYLLG
jgi:hypothetical protein